MLRAGCFHFSGYSGYLKKILKKEITVFFNENYVEFWEYIDGIVEE